MSNFADILKEFRLKNDWSQRKLAQKSGVSNTEISRIEKGERTKPSLDVIKKLSQAFGITVDELLSLAGITEQKEEYGQPKKPKDLLRFLDNAEVMFDGETYNLSDDDKAKIRAALEVAFWEARKKNQEKRKKKT